MDGLEACLKLGMWCDGLIARRYAMTEQPPVIAGGIWIGLGPRSQEEWTFTFILCDRHLNQDLIDWAALLPPEDRTAWLGIDFDAKHITIEPGASVPDG